MKTSAPFELGSHRLSRGISLIEASAAAPARRTTITGLFLRLAVGGS